MPVEFQIEDEGSQLTLKLTDIVSLDALEECLRLTEQHIAMDVERVLVLRSEATLTASALDAIKFGHKAGEIVARAGIAMAVVQAPEHDNESFVDAGMFSEGVLIAPFHDKDQARAWLLSKRPGKKNESGS